MTVRGIGTGGGPVTFCGGVIVRRQILQSILSDGQSLNDRVGN